MAFRVPWLKGEPIRPLSPNEIVTVQTSAPVHVMYRHHGQKVVLHGVLRWVLPRGATEIQIEMIESFGVGDQP